MTAPRADELQRVLAERAEASARRERALHAELDEIRATIARLREQREARLEEFRALTREGGGAVAVPTRRMADRPALGARTTTRSPSVRHDLPHAFSRVPSSSPASPVRHDRTAARPDSARPDAAPPVGVGAPSVSRPAEPATVTVRGEARPAPDRSEPALALAPPAPPIQAQPASASPVQAPPVSASQVPTPPVSAPPVSASQVPAPPVSAPPVSASPVLAPPVSAPPVSTSQVQAPPAPASPVSAPPVSALQVQAPPAPVPPVAAPPESPSRAAPPPAVTAASPEVLPAPEVLPPAELPRAAALVHDGARAVVTARVEPGRPFPRRTEEERGRVAADALAQLMARQRGLHPAASERPVRTILPARRARVSRQVAAVAAESPGSQSEHTDTRGKTNA